MRIAHIHPIFPLLPPPPLYPPVEYTSPCGNLMRLAAIHRRHLMLERIMNVWTRIVISLGFGVRDNFHKPAPFRAIA